MQHHTLTSANMAGSLDDLFATAKRKIADAVGSAAGEATAPLMAKVRADIAR